MGLGVLSKFDTDTGSKMRIRIRVVPDTDFLAEYSDVRFLKSWIRVSGRNHSEFRSAGIRFWTMSGRIISGS